MDFDALVPTVLRLPPSSLLFFSDAAALHAMHKGAAPHGAPVLYAPCLRMWTRCFLAARWHFTTNLEHPLTMRGMGKR